VNSPAVSIAVVIDSPSVGSHFGASVSAPVFHELAQQVLEYLGVPHDMDIKTAPSMSIAGKGQQEDGPSEEIGDLNGLFGDVNDLPADDPLRKAAATAPVMVAKNEPGSAESPVPQADVARSSEPPPASPRPETNQEPATKPAAAQLSPPRPVPPPNPQPATASNSGTVVVDASKRIAVPSFVGQSVRRVIEQAGNAGLAVQVLGNGIARDQAPAPGTLVPSGTAVVVRFAR
jgi:cell division protein FtsI (penicillin-binding protein 3)